MLIGDGIETSKVTIGGYNESKYSRSPVTWHNLKNNYYWTVSMPNVYLDNVLVVISAKEAIVDSGTSFLLMPTGKNNFSIIL